ncbi:hypothetical protein OG194_00140 [Streptomyces sp. NBC_01288]|uniref:hypothetical protein n=1 Tax=Streptomyces sp. NBC_01288 TaxID=2903814 RepID=UPI002E11702B|nr:hypothetical protein OG194_00140 [Streptomyces sp. NBC_01288]
MKILARWNPAKQMIAVFGTSRSTIGCAERHARVDPVLVAGPDADVSLDAGVIPSASC